MKKQSVQLSMPQMMMTHLWENNANVVNSRNPSLSALIVVHSGLHYVKSAQA